MRIAGVNVGKVTDGRAARRATRTPPRDDADREEGPADPQGRDARRSGRASSSRATSSSTSSRARRSAPTLGDGDTIPVNQTSAPVQIDQILGSLQTDTRKDLKRVLDELSTGLERPGRRRLQPLDPVLEGRLRARRDRLRRVARATPARPQRLHQERRARPPQALDRNDVQLKSLITDFNTTAAAFAARGHDLSNAIAELPRTLHAGMPRAGALNAAFPPLRRFIRDARPAVRSSGPALDASIPFADQLRQAVQPSELRGLVARPGADGAGADASCRRRRCRSTSRCAPRRAARTR